MFNIRELKERIRDLDDEVIIKKTGHYLKLVDKIKKIDTLSKEQLHGLLLDLEQLNNPLMKEVIVRQYGYSSHDQISLIKNQYEGYCD